MGENKTPQHGSWNQTLCVSLAIVMLTAAWLLYRRRTGPRSTAMRRNKVIVAQ